MGRHKYQGTFKDSNGSIVASGTVNVYEAGGTTAADVYALVSGGTAVASVESDSSGLFEFWVDDTEYAWSQLFKITLSATGYAEQSYDDLQIIPAMATSSVRAYKSASNQAVNSGVATKVTLDVESWDLMGEFASSTFTATVAGRYLVTAQALIVTIADGKQAWAYIYKAGAVVSTTLHHSGLAQHLSVAVTDVLNLAVGNTVDFYVQHDHGAARDIIKGSTYTYMCVQMLP